MAANVYVLGGAQTDFARNFTREGLGIFEMMSEVVSAGLAATRLDAAEVQTAHVGNFVAERFCGQGQLGGLFAAIDPAFDGVPASRHEAACASGSMALLAASADIEAGRYDLACVVGVELMRNVHGDEAAAHLGAAAWNGREAQDARYVWPYMFSALADEYARRYGLSYDHIGEIARINYENGRVNPNAQTRRWTFNEKSFTEDDEENPVIEGRIRRQDCGQVTDGASVVFLASRRFAEEYLARRGLQRRAISQIEGWGHRTATMLFADKVAASANASHVFPHVRGAITDAFSRAGIGGVDDLDAIETHDCFAITEYMAIDHFGVTEPGKSWQAVEDGSIAKGGRIPINPSGGLIGLGHPVGATGVRMALDAHRQVTGTAEACQVDGAERVATLNIGGSATTTVCSIYGTLPN